LPWSPFFSRRGLCKGRPITLTPVRPLRRVRHLVLLAAVAICVFPGSAQERAAPIVILISFDGWRWDYMARTQVPNLQEMASRGVRAEALIPVFPSKTFPNHYTIVTGLYPEHHGIVSNVIADPEFPRRFTMSAPTSRESRWWGGEPVWVTAVRQRLRAASMFWPGSEVSIGGVRPTYWRPFDDGVSNSARVGQVLQWLRLPDAERPSFITLYFSDVDNAGHAHGPDSPEVLEAARRLDAALGQLVSGVRKLRLLDRTTFVVVSDHGMSQQASDRAIFVDDYLDLSTVDVVEWTPNLALRPRSATIEQMYRALKDKHPSLAVYKREDIPSHLHYRANDRIPPVLALADDGWTITTHARHLLASAARRNNGGDHGYDPRYKSMHGLFVAAGPGVRNGAVVAPFENVHVYNFLCALLGLTPAANDGDAGVIRTLLPIPERAVMPTSIHAGMTASRFSEETRVPTSRRRDTSR
jgi:predicted AlkP superfamily pyrophosphatase or phosphodiesterase